MITCHGHHDDILIINIEICGNKRLKYYHPFRHNMLFNLRKSMCGGYLFDPIQLYQMSKVKVKFNYGNEHTVLINQTHKGPFNWGNLADVTAQPEKTQPHLDQVLPSPQKETSIVEIQKEKPVQPKSAQVKPALNTYKSAETLPSSKSNIREQPIKKKPTFVIEDADEINFSKVQQLQKGPDKSEVNIQHKAQQEAYIRAPSFKIPPKAGGKGKVDKKGYIKGENTEKYFYSGIPEKDEDQFVGCFGCMRRKPKAFSVEKPK